MTIEFWKTTKEKQRFNIEITILIYTRYNFDLVLKDLLIARKVAKWILKLGYLYQYKLAIYIDKELEELQKTKIKAAKKSWKHNIKTIQETYSRILLARDVERQPQTIIR